MDSESEPLITRAPAGKRFRKCAICGVAALVIVVVAVILTVTLIYVSGGTPVSATGQYSEAAAATDSQQCSSIATDVLRDGGSAVDAAISASLCIGLHSMQASGIGGGSFMMIYESPRNRSSKELAALDFREVAPINIAQNFTQNSSHFTGPLSIGVPGDVAGFWAAWQRYGRLPWKRLFQPVIDMARDGFRLQPYLGNYMRDASPSSSSGLCQTTMSIRPLLFKSDGSRYGPGDIMKLPKLAQTFSRIAENGGYSFYQGNLSRDILADLKDIGSPITSEDLGEYEAEWRRVLHFNVTSSTNQTVRFATLPAPSGGPVLNFMMNILAGYKDDVTDTVKYQRIVETFKFGSALKTGLTDPEFHDISDIVKNLTSQKYASDVRKKISDNQTHEQEYYQASGHLAMDHGTSHLNIYSPDGSAVSLTATINTGFGSKCIGPRTGILFNNENSDFDWPNTEPNSINLIRGEKRPLSSMVPVLGFNADGKVTKLIGAAGGSMITPTVAYVLWQNLFHDMPINKAIDFPRLYDKYSRNRLQYESGFPQDVLEGLKGMGHMTAESDGIAYCNAIDVLYQDNGVRKVTGVSDKRKGGHPDGF